MADHDDQDEFLTRVTALGKDLGLEGDKLDEYIEQHLSKKGGYKKQVTWVPDKGSGSGSRKSGSWF